MKVGWELQLEEEKETLRAFEMKVWNKIVKVKSVNKEWMDELDARFEEEMRRIG